MSHVSEHVTHTAKAVADVASATVAFAALLQWLPAIAAGFSILWYLVRIWDRFFGKDKPK